MMKYFMRVLAVLLLLTSVAFAQDATPEVTPEVGGETGGETAEPAGEEAPQGNSVTIRDQVSINGMIVVDTATIDSAGFVAIHADENGMPGHVVGIAAVPAGTSNAVQVMVDGAMATPMLHAMLHMDDSEVGVFEFGKVPGADAPVSDPVPFSAPAVVAFDQQLLDSTVVVASAIVATEGWVVVHADENGQPGPVLGTAPLRPGTNAPVLVSLTEGEATGAVWAMLHIDDGEIGTFEFDGQSGLDAPIVINEMVATRVINLTAAPTVLLANGAPVQADAAPSVSAAEQELAAGEGGAANMVASAVSPGAGFIDVHADMGGHPYVSLGVSPVAAGENMDVAIALMPPPEGTMLTAITPVVWPMLHLDTDADGQYRYLMIPGVDLPVVYNGAVVTLPVNVTGEMVAPMDDMMGGMDGMDDMGDMSATEEADAAMTEEAGAATAEADVETGGEMGDPTEEPTAEATEATAP